MAKEIIQVPILSEGVRKVGVPLSMVTKANGFVFVSGTPPFDLTTGKLVRGDSEVQTEAFLRGGAALPGKRRVVAGEGPDGAD
jgi:enamine deaminase RidA (YjgF/YER057c/UK114 family)